MRTVELVLEFIDGPSYIQSFSRLSDYYNRNLFWVLIFHLLLTTLTVTCSCESLKSSDRFSWKKIRLEQEEKIREEQFDREIRLQKERLAMETEKLAMEKEKLEMEEREKEKLTHSCLLNRVQIMTK